MAQPAHSTFGCVCCADMGVKVRELAVRAQAELKARVSTDGMDQFFGHDRVVQEAVTAEVVEVVEQISVTTQDSQYDSLLKLVNEQAARLDEQQAKLEAASFRIGYLEGQLDSTIKLLPDHQSGRSFWTKIVSTVKSTFAWPPTPDELKEIK